MPTLTPVLSMFRSRFGYVLVTFWLLQVLGCTCCEVRRYQVIEQSIWTRTPLEKRQSEHILTALKNQMRLFVADAA